MLNIFVDTSVFEKEDFYNGTRIKTLFSAASMGRVRILMPDLTEYEVFKHLEKKCDEHDGSNAIHKLENSLVSDLPKGKTIIKELHELKATLKEYILKMFSKELKDARVLKIKTPKDIDVLKIIDNYKRLEPPFSEKKRDEFPDAFVLETLEYWCEKNKEDCLLLSVDGDFKHYESERLTYKDYEVLVQELVDEKEMLFTKMASEVLEDSLFVSQIRDWIIDQFDCEIYFSAALQIEDINDYRIKDVELYAEKEDMDLIGMYDDVFVFEVWPRITTKIEVDHPDYDTAYYDNEDQKYYFIDENVKSTLTSEIDIPVEVSIDEKGNFVEVVSINKRKKLGSQDIVSSMSTKGYW